MHCICASLVANKAFSDRLLQVCLHKKLRNHKSAILHLFFFHYPPLPFFLSWHVTAGRGHQRLECNWCALSIWCDAPALGKRTACVMLHNNIWPHLKTWYQLSRILSINNLAGISLSLFPSLNLTLHSHSGKRLANEALTWWKWSRQADYGPFLSASLSDSFLNLIFILWRMILYALAHHLLTDWFSSRFLQNGGRPMKKVR